MVQSYKSLKATFLLGTISIINTPPKKSKGIHTYWLPMNQSAQHISGEKISNKVTLWMSLTHLEVGTMLQSLELNNSKMAEKKYKLPWRFITKMELKATRKENISVFLSTNKNSMLFQHKLLPIAQLPNNTHTNPRNPSLTSLMTFTTCNAPKLMGEKFMPYQERNTCLKLFSRV